MSVPLSNVKVNLKRRAVDTREKPKELLNHKLQSVPSALSPSLGESAVRKMVRRVRLANQIPVVEGGSVQDIYIPAACQMYQDGAGNEEMFLLGDTGRDDPERVLLFGREKHVDWSGEMKVVHMDGSFSITPPPFYQVYAILAERSARDANGGKWVFPVLYALLKSKTQKVYAKLFIMIKELWPAFNPTYISVDFELSAIQALIAVFPESMIAGCLFHLVNDFKKQISSCGLNERYREPEFSVLARMIISLAFVPPAEIWGCFERLKNHLPADLAPVLNWFKRNYVGTRERAPRFQSSGGRAMKGLCAGEDRTYNFAEAAHRRLHDALGVDHPTVGRLLQDLKRIQRNHDMHYGQYLAGRVAPKKRRVYYEADGRILTKVH